MQTINLLPDDYLDQQARSRANVLCMILFAVVMTGVVAASVVSNENIRHTRRVRDQVNKQYEEAGNVLAQIQQLELRKRERMQKAETTSMLLERVPRSYILAVLCQALPPNTSLTQLELKPSRKVIAAPGVVDPASSSAKVPPAPPVEVATLSVRGLAATDVQVARLLASLQPNPLLLSVNLGFSQETELRGRIKGEAPRQVREFELILEVNPSIDVMNLIDRGGTQASAVVDDVREASAS